MNFNPICVYDYETASRDPDSCQIIQVSGTMIHSRKLEIVDSFTMSICPDWDAEGCDDDTIEWHSKQQGVTKKAFVDKLKESPTIDIAWPTFVSWVDRYNFGKPGKSAYKAPISSGYNIDGFDNVITNRYCQKYGPTEKDRNIEGKKNARLFNGIHSFDVMKHMWFWFENIPVGPKEDLQNLQLTTLARYMGVPESILDSTHDAKTDVFITAQIVLRLFNMERYMTGFKPDGDEPRRRLHMQNCFVDKFPAMS